MSLDDKSQAVEADDVFYQVQRQLRRELLVRKHKDAVQFYSGTVRSWRSDGVSRTSGDSEEIGDQLHGLYSSLDSRFAASVARIGAMPPPTATARGFLGRVA